MATPPLLPGLSGLAWSRHKKPGFSTRVASHVSGREVRVALMSYPLYEFEAVYDGLTSSAATFAGLGAKSLQSLMGFFLQLQGQFGTFLYTDPDDNTVTGQGIGAGDGTTQSFVMVRALGGFAEPVGWVTSIANVYLNGVAQASSTYVPTAPNSLAFYAAPGAEIVITADFSYAFQCRFLDDQIDFEEFMSSLWKLDSMKFRSVKANNVPAAAPPPWYTLYAIGGVAPRLFADFRTEGGSNDYLFSGTTYSSCAALLTALGITFSRSSTAYYTNSSGLLTSAASGALRFDYDPVTLTPKGILLEGASTNLATYSGTIGGTNWTTFHSASVVTNNAAAPDGSQSASTLSFAATLGSSIYQGVTLSSGTYTISAWVRAASGSPTFGFAVYPGTSNLFSPDFAATSTWTRYSFTLTSNIDNFQIYNSSTNNSGTIQVWGAQVEALPFASSYIPTTSASATRAADSLSTATWAAITAGTLYAKADTAYAGQAQRILQIDDGTANNRATLEFNAGGAGEFDFVDGGTSEAALTAGTITANAAAQLAAAFQANDFALVANAGTPATASSGAIPALSKLRLGTDTAAANNLFGHIAQIGVWNALRAPNTNLQSLT